MKHLCLASFFLLPCAALVNFAPREAAAVECENWPGWRGPRGDGTSLETNVPTHWNGAPCENVAWKVAVPGRGHASPIVWGDRIFLVTCVEDEKDRALICLDREKGKTLWRTSVLKSSLEQKHTLNSYASSTPVTDGKLVYVTFLEGTKPGEAAGAQMAVAAYDFDGRKKWLVRPGPFSSMHGYCSCPVLYEDKVIVNGDHDGNAYLVALDRTSGQTVWSTPRENKTRSYSTPIIRQIDDRWQMILCGSKSVASYDPNDGSRHWIIDGPTEQFVASMVYNGDLLFMTAGFPDRHMLAIRPDGHGNVTDTHVAWRTTEACSYVPSPIAVGDYFLVVSDDGIASCFEAATGRRTWRKRIGPHYSASLVSAGGLAYFLSDEGVATLVKPGEAFDQVATNELGEACYASPAISQGRIYLRGEKHLFAVGP
ncbi:MAG TPA: PQQ-binding-like beta-propeller repeat protein [Pirellulales bacterium]|nr:PQQ-binding-like beta-propeller repeat protein [Pirellulales bacterium]